MDKYLDFAKELRKFWNMNMTVIPIVVGALGTVHKSLESGLEELEIRKKIETIQTTSLLRSTRILRRVLEIWGDTDSTEQTAAESGVKISPGVKQRDWQRLARIQRGVLEIWGDLLLLKLLWRKRTNKRTFFKDWEINEKIREICIKVSLNTEEFGFDQQKYESIKFRQGITKR